jgi:hypothetical protein
VLTLPEVGGEGTALVTFRLHCVTRIVASLRLGWWNDANAPWCRSRKGDPHGVSLSEELARVGGSTIGRWPPARPFGATRACVRAAA